jgi:hypothetical protein
METIRLNKKNRAAILANINLLYKPQEDKIKLPTTFYDDIMNHVYDTYYLQYKTGLPEAWYKIVHSIDINMPLNDGSTKYEVLKRLIKEYKVPHIVGLFSGNDLIIQPTQVPAEFIKIYNTYHDKLKVLEEEKNNFIEEARRILNNCNTIKQLVKVWPQAEHLITDDMKESLITKPKKPREPKQPIDEETLRTLNTNLLKHTMLNS